MSVVVRRYIDFLILLSRTPLILALFAAASLLCLFLKCYFSKHCSKNIQVRSKMEITWTWQYNYMSPETSTCMVPIDVLCKLRVDFVYDNGVIEISLLHNLYW